MTSFALAAAAIAARLAIAANDDGVAAPPKPPPPAAPVSSPPPVAPASVPPKSDTPPPSTPPASITSPLTVRVPNTTVALELVQVPGPPGADGQPTKPLWVSRTEVTWDLYDVFVYRLDEPEPAPGATGVEAVARPSKPYVPPDRGFGHNGFPAMGMTFGAATAFCKWLGETTGRTFRLPTEQEWEHFALAGATDPFAASADDAARAERPDDAWFRDNSDHATKPVGTRKPNAFGLFDMHGNVAEWVTIDDGGKPLAKGGSYRDPAEQLAATVDLRQTSAWNSSDPQVPKSKWWLADCPFVGFRVVMEEGAERK